MKLLFTSMAFRIFFFSAQDPAPPKDHVFRTAVWGQHHAEGTTQAMSFQRVKGLTLSSHTSISCLTPAVSQLYHHHPPSSPPTRAVFPLSVSWCSPKTLWGAACFSLIPSRRGRAGSAMFFRSSWDYIDCVCMCVRTCEHVCCLYSTAAILSSRLLLAECPLIELVLILQLHSAF